MTGLRVDRADLRVVRCAEGEAVELADGALRCEVEAFAITANNITYAVMGDMMRYWDFFPAPKGEGRVPSWGYARVTESTHGDIAVGERLYGFVPMGAEMVLAPARTSEREVVDGAAHRRDLPAAYNHYRRVEGDPLHDPDREAARMVCWPLFATAFSIDAWLTDAGRLGASQVVCSSASSRTAIATAFCLARSGGARRIGCTSARNAEFVRALGVYDGVVTYDEIDALDRVASVYLDFSGDAGVRGSVHRHLGDALTHSSAIGATHWEAMGATTDVPGPTPELFFAPDHIARFVASWGAETWDERIGAAWSEFSKGTDEWLRVERAVGCEAVRDAYLDALEGRADPSVGVVATFVEEAT